jgi:hypothetical protein
LFYAEIRGGLSRRLGLTTAHERQQGRLLGRARSGPVAGSNQRLRYCLREAKCSGRNAAAMSPARAAQSRSSRPQVPGKMQDAGGRVLGQRQSISAEAVRP